MKNNCKIFLQTKETQNDSTLSFVKWLDERGNLESLKQNELPSRKTDEDKTEFGLIMK